MTRYLEFNLPEAESYIVDDDDLLLEAIQFEADTIAADAGSDEIDDPSQATRDAYAQLIVSEASFALNLNGGTYTDPTGVVWSLVERED